jgi:hypothetical protein
VRFPQELPGALFGGCALGGWFGGLFPRPGVWVGALCGTLAGAWAAWPSRR